MIDETKGVLFTDGKDSVLFHPPEEYPDGCGFRHQVDIVSGPFRGAITASSYVGPQALGEFHQQLQAVYETLKGEASLPVSYEDMRMSVTGDGLGHIRIRGWVAAESGMEIRLTFSFGIDQTQLPKIIADVGRLFHYQR